MARSRSKSESDSVVRRLDAMRATLRAHAAKIETDPFTNSVFALAHDLFSELESNALTVADLHALTAALHGEALEARGGEFRARHERLDAEDPWADVRAALQALAAQGAETFATAFERAPGGIVFTAHPTFATPKAVRDRLAAFASAPDADTAAALRDAAVRAAPEPIDLDGEHAEAQAAIGSARDALRAYAEIVIDTARAQLPETWRDLAPKLPTIASWVGYDLDGRTDITWVKSMSLRLEEKAAQLGCYVERLEEIGAAHDARAVLDSVRARLEAARDQARKEAAAVKTASAVPDRLPHAVSVLSEETDARIVDSDDVAAALDALRRQEDVGDDLVRDLAVLRAEVGAFHLGTARIHLRLNAAQVRTVIRRELDLNTEDSSLGRVAMRRLADMAAAPDTASATISDLYFEQSTARRQFLMCAQILARVDARSPIRFLIAEAENPATVMGALYLARRYGVDHALDISPLFETPDSMERGGRFMERLLDEPVFRDYVARRGRLCVQLGFSDSGRFVGQAAAQMAIERLHSLIGRAMAEHDLRVPLVVFNTHGESMGRGGFPGDLEARLDHLLTPWTRALFAELGLTLAHESSYQGGDGYLHFATPALARATLAAHCAHFIACATGEAPAGALDDPFYARNDFVWDFYRALRAWHEALCADPDYAVLLNSFAASFLLPAGSRQTRRPDASSGPRGLRAISHNALLQQIAAPLNVACGVGESAEAEADRIVELANASPRLRRLLDLVLRGRVLTSAPALRAYAALYSPAFWVSLSKTADAEAAEVYRAIAVQFRDYSIFAGIERISDHVALDLDRFDRILARVQGAPSPAERHEKRLDLHVLHAVRQALMMRAFAVIARAPSFSSRHEASFDDLFDLVAHMRLKEAIELLDRIFPPSHEDDAIGRAIRSSEHGAEDAGEAGPAAAGYEDVRRGLVGELEAIDATLAAISLAVSHHYGAYG
ncbi:MAG: phosphoenolpyruvate carboxylase [Maricaulaceae bacterium]|jgi:phosphoenolpyruvate carboxylase